MIHCTHRSSLLALSPCNAFQMLNVMQQTHNKIASTENENNKDRMGC